MDVTITTFEPAKLAVKPIGDRLIVRRQNPTEVTPGGVVLPHSGKEIPNQGYVVAVGSGRVKEDGMRVPMEIEEGHEVIYSPYGGTEIEIDGEKYIALREADVICVL